ncbi:Bromodomain-containing protein [Giardia muris]|uniref:Bromodomain-containing protein n=1 Tax=Giardia muris TaxID=5742 RepID=A0A4Z1T257_GIAMU|nr:Bromodomain-containing protein [Giardia muris]|eukprot:TNJ27107.1 Bromodomain-containing protein [Giardia muris]
MDIDTLIRVAILDYMYCPITATGVEARNAEWYLRLLERDTLVNATFSQTLDEDPVYMAKEHRPLLDRYHSVIARPVAFSTIRRGLAAGAYDFIGSFLYDLLLISSNCRQFNASDLQLLTLADRYEDIIWRGVIELLRPWIIERLGLLKNTSGPERTLGHTEKAGLDYQLPLRPLVNETEYASILAQLNDTSTLYLRGSYQAVADNVFKDVREIFCVTDTAAPRPQRTHLFLLSHAIEKLSPEKRTHLFELLPLPKNSSPRDCLHLDLKELPSKDFWAFYARALDMARLQPYESLQTHLKKKLDLLSGTTSPKRVKTEPTSLDRPLTGSLMNATTLTF